MQVLKSVRGLISVTDFCDNLILLGRLDREGIFAISMMTSEDKEGDLNDEDVMAEKIKQRLLVREKKLFSSLATLLYSPSSSLEAFIASPEEKETILNIFDTLLNHRMSGLTDVPKVWKVLVDNGRLAQFLSVKEKHVLYCHMLHADKVSRMRYEVKDITIKRNLTNVWTILLDKEKGLLSSFLGVDSIDFGCLLGTVEELTLPITIQQRIPIPHKRQNNYRIVNMTIARTLKSAWAVLLDEHHSRIKSFLGEHTEDWKNLKIAIDEACKPIIIRKKVPMIHKKVSFIITFFS
jgi:hypothetical protein